MVRHHRFHQPRTAEQTGETEDQFPLVFLWTNSGGCMKRSKPKLLSILLISLLSCFFVSAHLFCTSAFSLLDSSAKETENPDAHKHIAAPDCSSISNGSIFCDRNGFRSDICFLKGNIRTHSASSSIFVYNSQDKELQHEKIKPYPRKWEKSVMNIIHELNLIKKSQKSNVNLKCDVNHDVPAVFFSTGGYTGNVYHEFNDGILPLFITSQNFKKRVVFVILEYHEWWKVKYADILSRLSDHPLIDFGRDRRTHCFSEAIVGLRIHDELTVDPSRMQENKTIVDFRNLLDQAYAPRVRILAKETKKARKDQTQKPKPKLGFLFRNGSRAITNEDLLVRVAKKIGFQVSVLRPDRTTELSKIYKTLNSSDVMVGVHGAAMTHFLFMRPACVFIQIIPLGTDWPAETYYGEPAKKLGLTYIGYPILPRESSLYDEYDKDDPVLADPRSITDKGWEFTKKVYLEHQTVRLDLRRFKKLLVDAYAYSISKSTHNPKSQQTQVVLARKVRKPNCL